MRTRFALISPLLCVAALAACVSEDGPPPLDPSTPMTTRHLNTSLDCADFHRNADGTWTATKDVTITSPNGPATLASGTSFREGSYVMGVDVAFALKRECATSSPP